MGLLDTINSAQNGAAVGKLAQNFGLSESQVQQALSQLVPGLAGGVKKNLQQPDGLESLLSAFNKRGHERYLDNPDELTKPEAVADGNSILGHLFGSKDVSRELANRASQSTGLDSSLLKQMLPMVAQMTMGALNKQANSTGMLGANAAQRGGVGGQNPLLAMLDADGDGSVVDDLLGLASRFLRR